MRSTLHHTEEFNAIVDGVLQSREIIGIGLGEDGREHYISRSAFDLELSTLSSCSLSSGII